MPTSAVDPLAQQGACHARLHTAAIGPPTRAALFTSRNPSMVGVGNVIGAATDFEGCGSVIPKSDATVARILRNRGNSTPMFGMGHITPA